MAWAWCPTLRRASRWWYPPGRCVGSCTGSPPPRSVCPVPSTHGSWDSAKWEEAGNETGQLGQVWSWFSHETKGFPPREAPKVSLIPPRKPSLPPCCLSHREAGRVSTHVEDHAARVKVEQPLLPLGHAVSLGLVHRLPLHDHRHVPILQDPAAGRDGQDKGRPPKEEQTLSFLSKGPPHTALSKRGASPTGAPHSSSALKGVSLRAGLDDLGGLF